VAAIMADGAMSVASHGAYPSERKDYRIEGFDKATSPLALIRRPLKGKGVVGGVSLVHRVREASI
jgi:hypothetical protein